jgi:hypothetical protein
VQNGISTAFIQRAAETLAETLSGSQIVSVTSAFAVDFNVDIPHASYPFEAGNKKTALFENLRSFGPSQQYQVIYELCDRVGTNPNATLEQKAAASQLKLTLLSRYYQFSTGASRDDLPVVVTEVKHWLSDFPEARKTYEEALQKHSSGLFTRNALDDLRLSLEALLRQLLSNDKSLEKQVPEVGRYIKGRGGSAELANMLEKLIDYYSKYQNTYVKHDDAVPATEAEFVIEISACFMKHLIRIRGVKSES